jgi:hypothetical protein
MTPFQEVVNDFQYAEKTFQGLVGLSSGPGKLGSVPWVGQEGLAMERRRGVGGGGGRGSSL